MARICRLSSNRLHSLFIVAFDNINEVFHFTIIQLIVIDHFPFEVREQGWGEFDVEVKVEFKNDAELPITFNHFLKLHPFHGEPSKLDVV